MSVATKKVLDFILSKSKKELGAELKRHIDEKITEKDCSRGIVHLLLEIFSKVLNDPQLESICGRDGRKDLKKLITVRLSRYPVGLFIDHSKFEKIFRRS